MKRILTIILVALVITLTGCTHEITAGNHEEKTTELVSSTDDSEPSETLENSYFFEDMPEATYTFEGRLWNDAFYNQEGEGSESYQTDAEGEIPVHAKLTVKSVANLTEGKIYELNFDVISDEKNKTILAFDRFYWVLNDAIYAFSLPLGFECDGQWKSDGIDYASCARALEEAHLLPDGQQFLLRYADNNVTISSTDQVSEAINWKDNVCTYSLFNEGTSTSETLKWEKDKGLTYFSYNYGAHREGLRIQRSEN